MVELAVALPVLALFLFGIIAFGSTMSFKQSLAQATNDAARAAAVSPRDQAVARAEAAADRATSGFGVPCNDGNGLTCSFVIAPCVDGDGDCMTVELTYDLAGHPRVPAVPGVTAALPDTIVSRAVVQVDSATVEPPPTTTTTTSTTSTTTSTTTTTTAPPDTTTSTSTSTTTTTAVVMVP